MAGPTIEEAFVLPELGGGWGLAVEVQMDDK